MPYIKYDDRKRIWETIHAPGMPNLKTAGELNYLITVLLVCYLNKHGLSYQTCNDIVGALDNAKDEFKRRIQNPYEDKKILENGDVYSV